MQFLKDDVQTVVKISISVKVSLLFKFDIH